MDAEKYTSSSSHLRQPDVYPDAGFLHPAAGIRHTGMAGGLGRHHVGLSSYFFILISAGHIWKFITLPTSPHNSGHRARLPGQAAGGRHLTAFFHRPANHVQPCADVLLLPVRVILFIAGAYFEDAWRNKTLPRFFKASAVLLVAALIGVAANLPTSTHLYVQQGNHARQRASWCRPVMPPSKPAADWTATTSPTGATASAKPGRSSFPNFKGGSSSAPSARAKTAMERPTRCTEVCTTHSRSTSAASPGPPAPSMWAHSSCSSSCWAAYRKGPLKWALLGATFFSIVLAWGKNFMPLTDFFIDYVPMCNKFRAVSSILVIAEFTIPLLAIFALKRVLEEPGIWKANKESVRHQSCADRQCSLLLAVAPGSLGSGFVPHKSADAAKCRRPADDTRQRAVRHPRQSCRMQGALVSADALRSFIIICIGCALLWLHAAGKLRRSLTVAGITVLCLVDVWV